MRRVVPYLLLSLFLLVPSAFAAVGVTPSNISVAVGDTATAQGVWISGISVYPQTWLFTSDAPTVASVSGSWDLPTGPGNGTVLITGLSPGVAHIVGNGLVFGTVTVTCTPQIKVATGTQKTISAGASVMLSAAGLDPMAVTYTWYEGAFGDLRHPLGQENRSTFTYYGATAGMHSLWVSIQGTCYTTYAAFPVEVLPVRQRAVRR
jgi:hypothetical protein